MRKKKNKGTSGNEMAYQKSLYVAQEVLLFELVVRTGVAVPDVVVSLVLFVVISDLTRLAIWDLVCLRK